MDEACGDVRKAQEQVFAEILEKQKKCREQPRPEGSALPVPATLAELDERPLTTYKDYQALFAEVASTGDWSKICGDEIVQFMETSGTTGAAKLYPMTFDQYQKCVELVLCSFATEPMPRSHMCNLSCADPEKYTESGIPRGQFINIGRRAQTPFQVKMQDVKSVFPWAVGDVEDAATSLYLRLLCAVADKNLRALYGNYATTILAALQFLEKHWDKVLGDIAAQELQDPEFSHISPELKQAVNKRLKELTKPKL